MSRYGAQVMFLSPAQARALIDRIGHRESSDEYEAVNTLGYAGRYQFGPMRSSMSASCIETPLKVLPAGSARS